MLVAKPENAGRLTADDGRPLCHVGVEGLDVLPRQLRGILEHSLRDRGTPAAGALHEQDLIAGRFQNRRRRLSNSGLVIVHERVVEKNDLLLPARSVPLPFPEPALERLAREGWKASPRIDADRGLEDLPEQTNPQKRIRNRTESDSEPARDPRSGHHAIPERMGVLVVVEREELRLEPRHVHVRRAFRLASLAADAEVHHLVEPIARHLLGGQTAVQYRAERVRPPARRVLFLPRDHERGTHRSLEVLAADPGAVAELDGPRESTLLEI